MENYKLTNCLFVISLISTFYSQAYCSVDRQDQKITLSATNIPLEVVFRKIKQQTGYRINNNTRETQLDNQKKVTINFYETDIKDALSFLLLDFKELTFSIKDKDIRIYIIDNLKKDITMSTTFPVSGKVVDIAGNPIPGATLKIKNTKQGAISNADGSFNFPNIEKGTTISITSIGFESTEVVANTQNILVRLKPQTNNLDERVIIAYGSTTKRLNTGNIGSIKAKDIEKQPVTNSLLSLQGRIPGVVVQQASGLPNSGVTIHIQGLNSLRSGNDPFFVIDGVPYISQLLPIYNGSAGSSGGTGISGNPLNFLNPGDIESIEILKDADATAIYGSRAANGAVLITTRKGKAGETRVDVAMQTGWGKVGHFIDALDTKDYLEMRHEALKNDGITTPSEYDFDLNGVWDTTRNVNWQKELIGNSAQFTNVQANISGGNSLTQFLVGAAYNKQTTVFKGDFSDTRGSLHFNINNTSSNQKLKTRLSASYMYDQNIGPMTDITTSAVVLAPVAPNLYNSDGSVNWAPNATGTSTFDVNPMASLARTNLNQANNLTSNLVISYEIVPGLEIKSSMGYNNLINKETTLQPLTWVSPESRRYSSRSTVIFDNKISSWVVEPQIEYKKTIKKGQLNFLIGSTISQKNSDQNRLIATGFNNDLLMKNLSSATKLTGNNINNVYKYNALYSRITYNWSDKYIVNLTARRDGSSRFGSENQFHNFGSVGAAWIFTQEPFIENTIPFLSFGKLRGSYGTTGNDQIQDYLFLDLYQSSPVLGSLYQNTIGLAVSNLTNPYLQWEETKKLQFGIELGAIQDRILFSLNYNRNRSSNQLLSYALPAITGFTSITRNFPATIQNTGWEFTLNTSNIKSKNFTWTSSFNLTIPKNKFLSFVGGDNYEGILVGQTITTQKVFSYAGLNDTTGMHEYRDSKGVLTTSPSDPDDKTSFANPDPKYYGGLQNSLTYKGVSIDFLFTFSKQRSQDDVTHGIGGYYPGTFNYGNSNQSRSVLNRWQRPGDKAKLQPFSSDGTKDLYVFTYSDGNWTDASYVKLKNISVSWQLPDSWNKKLKIQNSKIFINAQNLITFTNFKGFDPEIPFLSLPPLRVITFGIQIFL